MTNDFVCLPMSHTASEARAALQKRLKEPDFTHFNYIVESNMRRDIQTVRATTDLGEVALL
jgi:hypothetical protein